MDRDFQPFLLEVFRYGTISLGIVVLGMTIVASIAFYRAKEGQAQAFSFLVHKAGALQLIVVLNISVSVTLLALLGKLNSEGAIAIFSCTIGFALGVMSRSLGIRDERRQTN